MVTRAEVNVHVDVNVDVDVAADANAVAVESSEYILWQTTEMYRIVRHSIVGPIIVVSSGHR